MRFWMVLWVVGCSGGTGTFTPQGTATVTVATYNLYLGADLGVLFNAMSNPGPAVATIYGAVQASDPPGRMDAVAGQLAAAAPDLVALEEVALWRTQTPADGTTTQASDVSFDFLQLLLDGLARRGLRYSAAIVGTNADVEATGDFAAGAMDVRFTDRDVILTREGETVDGTAQNSFETQLMVAGISVKRGWVAVDRSGFRFLCTHLEAAADPIRDAQAAQILVDTANTMPLILAGDFNFAPGSLPYGTFTAAELEDSADAGPTCCQDPDLRNADSKLDQRIDLVWTRSGFSASGADRLGETPADKTASGLWPSDHAGVKVTLTR